MSYESLNQFFQIVSHFQKIAKFKRDFENYKPTPEKVEYIRYLLGKGLSNGEIATILEESVSNIERYRTTKLLGGSNYRRRIRP